MNSLGIVILNYLNYEDTLDCIESIKNQSKNNIPTVIIDNNSKNNSCIYIKENIKNNDNFYLIKSNDNLGYAKGNNIGIDFLKNNLKVENILICNNDIVFSDKDYIKKLLNIEFPENVGVIGTNIIGNDDKNQNPVLWSHSKKNVIKAIEKYENPKIVDKIKMKLKRFFFIKILIDLKSKTEKKMMYKSMTILPLGEYLHGSAILLTKNYFQVFDGFYPKTFLYGEEPILDILVRKANLNMMYVPDLSIFHKEDQSSAMSFGNNNSTLSEYLYQSNKIILEVKEKNLQEILSDFEYFKENIEYVFF